MEILTIIQFVLGGGLAVIIVFVLLRSFVLWYYKVDIRIKLMEEQNRLLRKLANEPEPPSKS